MSSPILAALRQERTHQLPVWFMRQAGRSLPEYRKLREGTSMLDSCLIPDMAAEITLQPVRRHGVDAAIFFSDIMIPLRLAGVGVEIQSGLGPVLDHPVRTEADVKALPQPEFADASMISEALTIIRSELHESQALLGFAGAPFTLAAYMVEGGPSKDHLRARSMMYASPRVWHDLMTWAARVSNLFLKVQIEAGADAIQLFDSWAGSLSRQTYINHVLPYSKMTLEDVSGPRIHFGTNTAPFLDAMVEVGADALGVDHRTPLDEAARQVPGVVLQGNIDPAMLFAGQQALHDHALEVVKAGLFAPAHIVNLGHGVPKETDPGVLTELVGFIHSLDPAQLAASHGAERSQG